jgi:hypothetical protein
VGAQDELVEIEVGHLEADRLRGAQAAGVHQLEQRPVAQVERLRAVGVLDQAHDLGAGQDVREAAAAAR